MADNLTTTAQVDPAVSTFYDRVLLAYAKPKLVHSKFATVKDLASKKGNTMKFRRYGKLATATTALTEGVTPPGDRLSKTDLTATVKQYGAFVHVTDIVDLTVEDAELTVAAEMLGVQLGETTDEIVRDILVACSSITNASNGTNGQTPTEIAKADIDDVVRSLMDNDAEMLTSMIKAAQGEGTSPVRAAYWGIIQTALIEDLEAVSGFRSVAQYPNQVNVDEAEWGSTSNVRWLASSVAHRDTSASPDEFKLPIIGKNAYCIVNLSAGNAHNIVKPFGSAGTGDPLNQRATSGWKSMFVSRILNDNFMHILKVTRSDSVDA